MNDAEQQKNEFEDDEQVQITDLDPERSPLHRRAQIIRALLRKSVAMTWIRYSLVGLLLLVLLGTIFREVHPFTQTAALPTSLPPTPTAQPQHLNVAFANNRIYIQSDDGTVSAYQMDSGHMFWRVKLPGPASFQANDQFLYAYFVTTQHQGRLEALSARNGRIAWWHTMPALVRQDGPEEFPISLQTDNGALYALFPGTLYVFRGSDGLALWADHYSPPISPPATSMTVQDKFVELQTPNATVHILDADNGWELFRVQNFNSPAPAYSQIDGRLLYELPNFSSASENPYIQVFHLPDGKRLWSAPVPSGFNRAVELAGVIYLMNSDSLTAMRGSDGHTLWTYKVKAGIVDGLLGDELFGPVEKHGLLYLFLVGNEDNTLVAIHASNGQSAWSMRIAASGQPSNAAYAVFESGIILFFYFPQGNPEGLANGQPTPIYALSPDDGKILWRVSLPSGTLVIQNGVFYLQQNNGQIDAWRASDHQHLWRYQAHAGARVSEASWPGASDTLILYNNQAGQQTGFEVLRASDGKLLWSYRGS